MVPTYAVVFIHNDEQFSSQKAWFVDEGTFNILMRLAPHGPHIESLIPMDRVNEHGAEINSLAGAVVVTNAPGSQQ